LADALDQEYGEIIRSDIADIKNVGNRTAAQSPADFSEAFCRLDAVGLHLDIAGTAWAENERPYIAKGATGFGVRLMATFVLNRAAANQHMD